MSLVTLTIILFLIMDPIGHVQHFLSFLRGIEPRRQKKIIAREMLIALVVTYFFSFFGNYVFVLLQISNTTVYISSGIILFLVAIRIIFPSHDKKEELPTPLGEPFLVPLAIPLIAGPALLATVMLYAQTETDDVNLNLAILIAWLASSFILLNAKRLYRVLGTSGLTACERLMGMVLVLLAVQRFLQGVIMLLKS